MMNDPVVLMAFVIIYLVTGVGLMALAGGFSKPRLQEQPVRIDSKRIRNRGN